MRDRTICELTSSQELCCGLGGFATGLASVDSTVATGPRFVPSWGVEKVPLVAEAFALNHRRAKTFAIGVNDFLNAMLIRDGLSHLDMPIDGRTGKAIDPAHLPRRGDVDLLLAGPACQGAQTMGVGELIAIRRRLLAEPASRSLPAFRGLCGADQLPLRHRTPPPDARGDRERRRSDRDAPEPPSPRSPLLPLCVRLVPRTCADLAQGPRSGHSAIKHRSPSSSSASSVSRNRVAVS